MTELTPKQARFVNEYLVDLNATQAAIRTGYSARNADKIGPALLGKSRVAAAIAERRAKLTEAAELSTARIVEEIDRLAIGDLRALMRADGSLLPPADWPATAAACVASIEYGEGTGATYIKRIRLWSKPEALRLAAQYRGMLVERHEHTGKDGGPIEVTRIERVIVRPPQEDSGGQSPNTDGGGV